MAMPHDASEVFDRGLSVVDQYEHGQKGAGAIESHATGWARATMRWPCAVSKKLRSDESLVTSFTGTLLKMSSIAFPSGGATMSRSSSSPRTSPAIPTSLG